MAKIREYEEHTASDSSEAFISSCDSTIQSKTNSK